MGDFEANAQLLCVLDLLVGHTSASPLCSPPPPPDPARPVVLELARCNVLQLRLLAKAREGVQRSLSAFGLTLAAVQHAEDDATKSTVGARLELRPRGRRRR